MNYTVLTPCVIITTPTFRTTTSPFHFFYPSPYNKHSIMSKKRPEIPPETLNNRYFHYFHNQVTGRGIIEDDYVPNLGQVYNYNIGLRRGRGQFYGRHRGFGLGSFFSSLLQRATPFLRNIGNHAVNAAANIAKEAIQGNNIKEAAIKHISNAVAPVVQNLLSNQQQQQQQQPPPPAPKSTKKRKIITTKAKNIKRAQNNPNYTALSKIQSS